MNRNQKKIVNAIGEAWEHHPQWSILKLIRSAATIGGSAIAATEKEILSGLKALIPSAEEQTA